MSVNKYFEIKEFFNAMESPVKIGEESVICYITGTRNIGKSYSSFSLADEISLKVDKKLVYIRNTQETIKAFRHNFNADWKDKYRMSLESIFKLDWDADKKKFIDGDLIGYVCTVKNYEKFKSMSFNKVNMIIYDEFNTKDLIQEVFYKFNHLCTSIIRQSKNITIMCLANRDNENNEFSVNLGDDDYQVDYEDYAITQSDETSAEGHRRRIIWLELGTKWSYLVKNEDTLFNDLAKFDTQSINYLKGEYNVPKPRTVINYASKIKDTFIPYAAFNFSQKTYYLGNFIYKDSKCKALVKSNNYGKKFNGVSYNLDGLSRYIGKSIDLSRADSEEIVTSLIIMIKKNMLYFDSFDMKMIFDAIMVKNYTQEKGL